MPRQYENRGAEPQCRRLGGEKGEEIQRRRDLAKPGKMVLDQKDAVKPERFRFTDIVDVIGIDPAVISLLAHFGARTAEQPKTHDSCLLAATLYAMHSARSIVPARRRSRFGNDHILSFVSDHRGDRKLGTLKP